jgi:uncharacterized protein YdaU (DUF1376 family)
MAEFPKFPLWTDAYLGDTHHLTTIEHGAYLLLLITMWRSKTRMLPDDDRQLANFTHLKLKQWQRIRPRLIGFFKVENSMLSNGKLLDEYEAVRQHSIKQSNAGKASALKRLNRGSTTVQPTPQPNSTPSPSPSPNPTIVEPKGSTSLSPPKPAETKKPRRKPHTAIPDNFPTLSDMDGAVTYWGTIARFDLSDQVQREADQFRDHHLKCGSTMANWDAAWRTWFRETPQRTRMNGSHHHHKESEHEKFERVTREFIQEHSSNGGGNSSPCESPELELPAANHERKPTQSVARDLLSGPIGKDECPDRNCLRPLPPKS